MFRSQQRKAKILFGLSDVLLTAAAFEISYRFRHNLHLDLQFFLAPDVRFRLIAFSVLTWVTAGYGLNVYGKLDEALVSAIVGDALRQVGYSALATIIFIFFGLHMEVSRIFLGTFFLSSFLFLTLFRISARNLISLVSRSLGTERYILIIGLGERAERLGRSLEGFYNRGVRIVGFLAPPGLESARATISLDRSYRVFPVDQLRAMLAQRVIDEVHFAVESEHLPALEEVFLWCDEEGVCNRLAVDFFPHVNSGVELERVGNIPLLTFAAGPGEELPLFLKRLIDITVSLVLILLLSPLLLLIALIVRVTSPGPAVFRQERCGLNGRTFTLYKFRSMNVDAEKRWHEVAHLTRRDVAMKIPNDPRQTAIGKWLRKFSLDELPQLFNVVAGDMSIVGPRPALQTEVVQYQRWQRRRLRMRPGLTCLWAVQGRDRVDFETWMRLDLEYIDRWSLGLDARIMLMTIPQVVFGRGAS